MDSVDEAEVKSRQSGPCRATLACVESKFETVFLSIVSSFLILGIAFTTAHLSSTAQSQLDDYAASPTLGFDKLGWVAFQAFLLMMPVIGLTLFATPKWSRSAKSLSATWILLFLVAFIFDSLSLHWMGERISSPTGWYAISTLLPSLLGHLSTGIAFTVVSTITLSVMAILGLPRMAKELSCRCPANSPHFGPVTLAIVAFTFFFLASLPAFLHYETTLRSMRQQPSCHPFCLIGLVQELGVGPKAAISLHEPLQTIQVPLEPSSFDKPDFRRESYADERQGDERQVTGIEEIVRSRQWKLRQLGIKAKPAAAEAPDIVLVIVESLRRELITQEVMPNLNELASDGMHCQTHFSGGNATNHGVFSIVSGMEAVWYDTDLRYTPSLNRLFRAAGYQIGFFAGDDDWRTFYMDGFINPDQYDAYEVRSRKGLATDRRAVELAASFLNQAHGTIDSERQPRLAVVYLYSTHAMYSSFVDDRLFQPAADDRFAYPYTAQMRSRVWNRYKNSARSVDRLLSALFQKDRVILVTGDHGESFLEDATIGHGIRISEYQNMTPAILHAPGEKPRIIKAPTMHADLLPTLLSAINCELTDDDVLDGVSLLDAKDEDLGKRVLTTRNYLHPDVGLIGAWTTTIQHPFAFRASITFRKQRMQPLNAIDNRGFEIENNQDDAIQQALRQWKQQQCVRSGLLRKEHN